MTGYAISFGDLDPKEFRPLDLSRKVAERIAHFIYMNIGGDGPKVIRYYGLPEDVDLDLVERALWEHTSLRFIVSLDAPDDDGAGKIHAYPEVDDQYKAGVLPIWWIAGVVFVIGIAAVTYGYKLGGGF